MDSQGGNITRITDSNENHFILGIDPSGRYIVSTRGTEEKKRLWMLDLAEGKETPLTDAENHAEGRTFSPDGEWIVFWMIPAGETTSDIYRIRRGGTDLTNLTNTPRALEFDPAWSNGGVEIAFTYNDLNPNRFVLKAMDTNGMNIRTIYDPQDAVAATIFPAGVYDPDWSPDDAWILIEKPIRFTGDGENGHAGVWRILKVRTDGSEVVDLTGAGEFAECALYLPSFSPDGDSIVFSSRCGPVDPSQTFININTMDSTGGSIQKLTDTPLWEQFAVWIR
jgi:Tol biopolymer transport system component